MSVAIEKMTGDIKNYIKEKEEADKKAAEAEEENARLAEKAEAAAKIAQISKSMTTLLDNMPALTFYKDSENGKYIACNQAFAEYACRNSPKDVIGLTDFEIFDSETAAHFTEDDKKALSMDVPYILLETVPDAAGNLKYFQTTKLKFKDTAGETRLLGMCVDLTEMASIRNESEKAREAYEAAMSTSLTYSRIAHALSTDYTFIYYVNIDTDEYIEYRNLESGENLNEEQRGHDFFDESRKNALTMLYAGDREVFINAFTKENVLEKIDSNGAFTFTYRLLIDGTPTYMNMKATRIKDDPMHIIFGVYNVDEQMKYRETLQRLDEERTTYSRITALSGDFICIYTVDPETERYVEYSATSDYDELGFAKEGDAFFDKAREDGEKALYYEDKDMFLSMLTRENVLSEVKDHGIFSMKYRLIISGKPEYVMLKAALVNEKGGPQLIIGVNNIDAQIKREQEYDYNLSVARSKANIDALTGVKNKHAYVDTEALLNSLIEERDTIEFAIAVFDVNDLKKTNDTMGHRAGDDLIRGACSIICRTFKHSPVFRVGGDEFAVIAQGQDYENMEALVKEVAEINLKNKQNGGVVVACGMAKYSNERSVAEVFERADNAMYENKHKLKE